MSHNICQKFFRIADRAEKAGDALFAVWPHYTATVAVLLVHFILRVQKYGILKWVSIGFFQYLSLKVSD